MKNLLDVLNQMACVALIAFAAHGGWVLWDRLVTKWSAFLRKKD